MRVCSQARNRELAACLTLGDNQQWAMACLPSIWQTTTTTSYKYGCGDSR
ncbi:hypothetical protein TGAM01_v207109 [Trichoderma gamsii]|uniref:Uncharacterized protein n=1 Tax=Trichoderma gamsii TaxID=398673 RepID=A0A2P4ZII5_9HYPO|nr:hypothetical protein TGAM01_v207109 [Trichoderma gamsii]PON24098.1 hypothetical protein TGAM01_v207109 [Trichoderma gamsii]